MVVVLFWLLAIIHFLPAVAAVSPTRIKALYGVAPTETAILTLLQHRALLLGLVGGAFLCAAYMPALRWPALIGGGASMLGFLAMAATRGELSGSLRQIVIVDALGAPAPLALVFLLS